MNPETKRGLKEGRQHFQALHARWPQAFPAKGSEVRPLAIGATPIVAAEMGWSWAYARAVLKSWKAREPYCRAILVYPTRFTLDGGHTDEEVDDQARAMAQAQIEKHKERRARLEAERQTAAAEKPADVPPPPPPPPEAPRKGAGFAALRQAHRDRIAAQERASR